MARHLGSRCKMCRQLNVFAFIGARNTSPGMHEVDTKILRPLK